MAAARRRPSVTSVTSSVTSAQAEMPATIGMAVPSRKAPATPITTAAGAVHTFLRAYTPAHASR